MKCLNISMYKYISDRTIEVTLEESTSGLFRSTTCIFVAESPLEEAIVTNLLQSGPTYHLAEEIRRILGEI